MPPQSRGVQSNRAFGIQSKKNEHSITELLQCPSDKVERDYPDLSGKKRKGRLPPAKATKSSSIVAKCREPPTPVEAAKIQSVEEFKLTRFKNVRPRVCVW